MAEDLGFIEVRIPEQEGSGAIVQAAPSGLKKVGEEIAEGATTPFSRLTEGFKKLGSLRDIFTTAAQGGGVRATLGAATEAATGIGGKAGGVLAAGFAAVGLGVAAVVAIKAFVGGILARIDELARVNALMAREAAQNKLAEISRDIKEAKVMGPLYSMVSGMARSIMTQIQPLILGIKTALIVVLMPLLKVVELVLSGLNFIGSWIVQGIGMLYTAMGQALQLIGNLVLSFSQSIPGWADPGGVLSGISTAMGEGMNSLGKSVETVGGTLEGIAQMMRNQQNKNQNVNAWATDTLSALSGAIQPVMVGTRKRGRVS